MKKIISYCFLLFLGAQFFTSCLNSDDDDDNNSDAQIYKFILKSHDSIPGLSKYIFTIDQINGRIFNQDSLPYGSDVSKLVPEITFYSAPSSWVVNDTQNWKATDSLDFTSPVKFTINSSDKTTSKDYMITVNVHKTDPEAIEWQVYYPEYSPAFDLIADQKKTVLIDNTLWMFGVSGNQPVVYQSTNNGTSWSRTGLTGLSDKVLFQRLVISGNKFYVTDTVQYKENGIGDVDNYKYELFDSEDGINWNQTDVSLLKGGFSYLLGSISGKICGIVKDEKNYIRFFTTTDFQSYEYSTQIVPNGFPLSDFASLNFPSRTGYPVLMVALGFGMRYNSDELKFYYNEGYSATTVHSNMFYSTMDGLNWTCLTFSQPMDTTSGVPVIEELFKTETVVGKKRGAMLFAIDDVLYIANGVPEGDIYPAKDLFYSDNGGLIWNKVPKNIQFPVTYEARMNASAIVDEEGYVSIYGGNTRTGSFSNFWRGRMNKKNFR